MKLYTDAVGLGREMVLHRLLHHIPIYIMPKDVATATSLT